ncbi:MAG TPA: 4-hydroxythreonine-4-phosphate dehydrogenase PdxA [Spirochaetota bacterium]|nr:4-hydroxythreonine-4-phosphate dehydrogenase PdxA [Spirochaetota bacterium]
MQNKVPVIAITIGDPAGIGPEVTLKALSNFSALLFVPLIICRTEVLIKHYHDLMLPWDSIALKDLQKIHTIDKPCYVTVDFDGPVPNLSNGNELTGKESLCYIDAAIDLWKKNIVDAMVTGPVNKSLIEKWVPFIGHTEYIAQRIHEPNPRMLMYSGRYNVLLVTTHVPVYTLSYHINYESILTTVEICNKYLKKILHKQPVLAICGLDPHCGDKGAIGAFDTDVTAKVVKDAVNNGILIEGPFSADTLFMPQRWQTYDCVIAFYHDQGLIPFKMVAFDEGVNITAGLSIVRTSVDHGTAFDIAGKNCAQFNSMKRAIELACYLSK